MKEDEDNKADESNWDDELYSSQRNKPIDTVDVSEFEL